MDETKSPALMLYYNDYLPISEHMSRQDLGELVYALLHYGESGQLPEEGLSDVVKVMFGVMRSHVDLDAKAYGRKVKRSTYGNYVKKCKEVGATPVPFDDWIEQEAFIPIPAPNEPKGSLTSPNEPKGAQTVLPEPNYNPNPNPNYNPNPNPNPNPKPNPSPNTNPNPMPSAVGGSRRPSSDTKEKDKRSLPKWADAPETMKEEISELTREVFSKFVPSRLPEKADALKMYERVCAVDDDGKIYVNAERTQLVCEAFAHAQEEGKPGNSVAIYRYLKEVSA